MLQQHTILTNKRIPQLDGLRGIAILLVLCFHYFPGFIAFNFGWSGVDLFFVLSGFLITSRLMPFLDDKKLLVRFYSNRFLRIVPLYFAFLTLFFSGWFLLSSKTTLASFRFYSDHWQSFFLFFQNWVFANHIHEAKTHLQHLWSIAVEEQIYLLFPVFLLVIKNKKLIFNTVLCIIAAILITRLYYLGFLGKDEYASIYVNTFFRLDSFLSGVIVYFIYAEYVRSEKFKTLLPWLGILCFLSLLIYIIITKDADNSNAFISGGGFTLIAIMYASLLWITLLKKYKIVNKVMNFKFLRFTGKISYGMYIFHWPIFILGFALLNKLTTYLNYPVSNNTIHIINVLLCIPATYLFSFISFRYFESYFLNKKIRNV